MKKILFIAVISLLFLQLASAQSKWTIGIGVNNGFSFADRQFFNNKINNRKTVPTSAAYYNQFKIFGSKSFKSGKGFWDYTLSHRVYGFKTKVYDTRLKITNGNDPVLSKASYRYRSFNFAFSYNRYIKKMRNIKLFAGLGLELNYYYRNIINLHLKDGKQTIKYKSKQMPFNVHFNNLPTLMLKLGGEFTILNIPDVRASIVYKKDLHYFLPSAIPIFSSYGISLEVPLKTFGKKTGNCESR